MKLPKKLVLNFQKELGKYCIELEYKNNLRCRVGVLFISFGCKLSGMKYELKEI